MRKQVLTELHDSHQGAVCTKQRARLTIYWPNIDNDIEKIVISCKQRQDHLLSNYKEPILLKSTPVRLFQEVTNFCSHDGQHYLILVDCCIDWPTIGTNTTASHLVATVRRSFCFWSDKGPQSIHFKDLQGFCTQVGILTQNFNTKIPTK